ncbi:cystathionine beta-lyase [Acidihalobacter ferrooxydans]|uniref:Cystathionine beta-lyase n=1 Tax=Acidihalobacter ferrooxydans TaxID=1765967 RepID=A0A1P8UDI9_9GAMM|nr:cystathionine beta-lyase [Acidihalobacter ferrooxydans]APZ41829.1 cystathionine beta-lyase [Acidihalobacter ferrooxydans]
MSRRTSDALHHFRPSTRLTHLGRDTAAQHGFVNPPIYRGSTVLFDSMDDLLNDRAEFTYGLLGNPSTAALQDAWSDLAGAAGTILAPSGLMAITTALLAVLQAGDHLLVTDSVYGPTRSFCDKMLKRFGVETTYYDPRVGTGINELIRPNTRAVFLESPGSLTFEIQDVPAITEIAHAHGAAVILDNTWATPLLFDAHGHGVDIVVEAGTKYLSGASDLLFGLASATEKYWPALRSTHLALGSTVGPEDVFLCLRGLRTMLLRLRESERQALDMAHWLAQRPEVAQVLHPALEQHPDHTLWQRDYTGSSGLFSIILQPAPQHAVAAMLDGLQLFGMGYSWGGFESLVTPIDPGAIRTATSWQANGPALRFYIGLEDTQDLKDDLDAGFARLRTAQTAP